MGLMKIVNRYIGRQPPRADFESTVSIGQPLGGSVQSYVGTYSYTGRSIDPQSAMESPSVYACVRLIASSIARLEWQILRETASGKINESNHPLASILNYEFSDDVGAMSAKETLLTDALLTGNGYAYIHRDTSGRPAALELLRPDYMGIFRDGDNQPYYQAYLGKYDGKDAEKVARKFRAYDIFHLVGPTMDGLLGVAPIHMMRDLIGLELTASEYCTRFWSSNAVPSGVLKMPGRLSPDASKRLREAWQAAHGGASRAGRVAVLEDGMSYEALSGTMKDNELIAIRRYCRQQISAMYGVPAHRIGDTESQSYASAESADQSFVKHTLAAWATRLEQEASRKLIVRGEPYCTRISFDSMLRADMSTRFTAYAVAVTNGILTPNEVRAMEGRPAVDGGDSIRLPLNTATPDGASADAVTPAPVGLEVQTPAADEPAPPVTTRNDWVGVAIAAIRPSVERAFRKHLDKTAEYLLRQKTQTKIDRWEPAIADLVDDLQATISGVAQTLGRESQAVAIVDDVLLRHAKLLRRSVGEISELSDTIAGWQLLPGGVAVELLSELQTKLEEEV